jgi:hypothetical protein
MMAYTYRDPLDDYNAGEWAKQHDPGSSYRGPTVEQRDSDCSERAYKPPEPGHRSGMAGAFIAIAVVGGIMAYGASRSSTSTANGPNSTILAPVIEGHGGTAR